MIPCSQCSTSHENLPLDPLCLCASLQSLFFLVLHFLCSFEFCYWRFACCSIFMYTVSSTVSFNRSNACNYNASVLHRLHGFGFLDCLHFFLFVSCVQGLVAGFTLFVLTFPINSIFVIVIVIVYCRWHFSSLSMSSLLSSSSMLDSFVLFLMRQFTMEKHPKSFSEVAIVIV